MRGDLARLRRMCGVDEDEAQDILADGAFSTDDAELSWDLQYMTAKAAAELGYSIVEMRDSNQSRCKR